MNLKRLVAPENKKVLKKKKKVDNRGISKRHRSKVKEFPQVKAGTI